MKSTKTTFKSLFRMNTLFGLLLTLSSFSTNGQAQEKKRTIHLELAYAETSGNTSTRSFAGKFNFETEQEPNRFFLNNTYLMSRNRGKMNANRLTSDLRMERVLSGRLFGFLEINYLRDKFAGFDHRLSSGPGLGIDIITNPSHLLKSLASFKYDYENYSFDGTESSDYSSIDTDITYAWKINSQVEWKWQVDMSQSLKNRQKYFITGETHLSAGIGAGFSIGLSYLISYQNLVPESTIRRTDSSFLTSVIIDL
ncbi:DUF481 domain-containing protein [bacterium]|nr:DUF481 domain-containing protein [bacterium]